MRNHHFAVLGLILVIVGCSDHGANLVIPDPSNAPFTVAINGKSIACSPNECFSLELDLNADAGNQWDHNFSDPSVLQLDSTAFRPKDAYPPGMVGGLAIETFHFRATKTGRCAVDLIQHQAWEPDVPPIQTVRFVVVVQPK